MMSLTRVRLPVRVFTFWSTSGSAARSTITTAKISSLPPPSLSVWGLRTKQPLTRRRFFSARQPTSGVDYETASDETLESLCDHLEELFEGDERMAGADISLANGVLTIAVPDHGTFVVNKQSPNRQIWLSSPISGPARFDLVPGRGWLYKRTDETLHCLLNREIGQNILGLDQPGLEKCYLGSGSVDN